MQDNLPTQPTAILAVEDTQPSTPDAAQNAEVNQGSIPYDRFKQVNDAKRAAETELERYRQAERDREQQEAIQRGEFETVLAELRPKAERVQQLEDALNVYLEAEIAEVPQSMRDLVPTGDITTQLAWIKQAKQKGLFNRQPAPQTDAGVTGDPKPQLKLSDQEQAIARKLGLTAEQYAKSKRA